MPSKPKSPLKPSTEAALSALDSMWASVDAAIEKAGMSTLAERPANSFTCAEYAERKGLGKTTAQGHLERMVKTGVLNRFSVRIADARGHITPTNVYTVAK